MQVHPLDGSPNAGIGDQTGVQEPVFIPRSQDCPEGDGYLIVFLNHFDTMLSSLALLDTKDLSAGPIARIKLPFRLRSGVHGSWVTFFKELLISGAHLTNAKWEESALRYDWN